MPNFIEKIIEPIQSLYFRWKYRNYDSNEGYEDLEFIWGLKSWDDLTGADCNIHTMNDIDIIYDKKDKVYLLSIETAYIFKDNKGECEYLKGLLNAFTKFMKDNNYSTDYDYVFFMNNPCTSMKAETIEELYINFRIFTEGYCKIYE